MMDRQDALTILESLLDGIDPETGEVLQQPSVLEKTCVMRALHTAVMALGQQEATPARMRAKRRGRERAGEAWTQEEDEQLFSFLNDDMSYTEIAAHLKRSSYAISCRVEKLRKREEMEEEIPF